MHAPTVGVDGHVDLAHKHPEGALCAAGVFYPPLQSDGEAATIQRTALLRQLAVGLPLQSVWNAPGGNELRPVK